MECRRPGEDEPLLHRVVVARDADRRLAHRVIATWVDADGERWVRMRGDNSAGCEDVPRRDVIAVVDAIFVGGVRVSLRRVPPWVEGSVAWIGRQVVCIPRRIQRARRAWRPRRLSRAKARSGHPPAPHATEPRPL